MGKYDVKYIVVGLILSLLASGCSTRRNTPGTRAWHELNTRYNIYFNAETDYNETLESVLRIIVTTIRHGYPCTPTVLFPTIR